MGTISSSGLDNVKRMLLPLYPERGTTYYASLAHVNRPSINVMQLGRIQSAWSGRITSLFKRGPLDCETGGAFINNDI